jgi:hypothetical protein
VVVYLTGLPRNYFLLANILLSSILHRGTIDGCDGMATGIKIEEPISTVTNDDIWLGDGQHLSSRVVTTTTTPATTTTLFIVLYLMVAPLPHTALLFARLPHTHLPLLVLAKYEYDTANGVSYSYPYCIHLGGAISYS